MIKYYIIISGLVLFEDYNFSPKLMTIDADTVSGPYFVIDSESKNKLVCLAKERELWVRAFTKVL